jgi:glycosyltransferase involved in cell wall biosynthesis
MKIIHVPFCFAPDPMGGTEIYAAGLARDIQEMGFESLIAAPGTMTSSYTADGLCVRRFEVSSETNLRQLYGEGDPHAAAGFEKILDEEKPDLVHLHAFTQGVSVRLVRAAKQRGLPVVFTYHTPTVSCQRGTLVRWGTTFCDGKLNVRRCASCTLHGLGLNRAVAYAVGAIPPAAGRRLGDANLHGGVWTALRMSELIVLRHAMFHALMAEVDHIVAVCNWVRDVLLLNDVPSAKITLCRHGIRLPAGATTPRPTVARAALEEGLRIAFVGRFDPTKGIHVIVDAFRMEPALRARLDIYGVVQGESNERYRKKMQALAGNDPRIHFCNPVSSEKVVPMLRDYDVLAVPSQWLETGPLVALEAFAAGIPVIGWNIGGIAEIVQHQVNGLLVEPGAAGAWRKTLRRLAEDPVLLARLKAGVQMPRSSTQVTQEMLRLYNSLLQPKPPAQSTLSPAFSRG